MQGSTLFATLFFLGFMHANAHCPNMCSGHGSCGQDNVCTCYNGFTFPDCSARLCRESRAWYDNKPSASLTSHGLETECSAAGLCDRKTGYCKCFSGWTGTACERLLCPGDMNCNGHGTCETLMEQNAIKKTTNADASGIGMYLEDNDDNNNNNIDDNDKWDADKIVGCNCDFGWTNYDCSYRLCPRGDDPILVDSATQILTLSFWAGEVYEDQFQIEYYGKRTDSIKFEAGQQVKMEERISESLHRHPYIKDVTVDVAYVRVNEGLNITLTFNQIHSQIFLIDGSEEDETAFNPDHATVHCKPDACAEEFKNEDRAGSYQHEECSKRGLCDSTTGLCKCFDGYTGDACEIQSALAF